MSEELQMMENLDPKEVEQFKTGFQLARQMLYQPQTTEAVMGDIESRGITEAVAGILVMVLQKVQESVGQLSLSVAAALGLALLDDLFDFLEQTAGVQNDSQTQSQVLQSAVTQWLSMNNIPPEQLAQELQADGAPPEMLNQLFGGAQPAAPASQPAQPAGGMPPGIDTDIMQRV